jgi:hypothetical protein
MRVSVFATTTTIYTHATGCKILKLGLNTRHCHSEPLLITNAFTGLEASVFSVAVQKLKN